MRTGLGGEVVEVVDASGRIDDGGCGRRAVRQGDRRGDSASVGQRPGRVSHLIVGAGVGLTDVDHRSTSLSIGVGRSDDSNVAVVRSLELSPAATRSPVFRVPPKIPRTDSDETAIVQVPRKAMRLPAAPVPTAAALLCPSEKTRLDWVPLGLAAAPQAAVWPLATFLPRPVPRLPNPHNPVCARAITPERVPVAPAVQVPISLATFASVAKPSAPSEQVPR